MLIAMFYYLTIFYTQNLCFAHLVIRNKKGVRLKIISVKFEVICSDSLSALIG